MDTVVYGLLDVWSDGSPPQQVRTGFDQNRDTDHMIRQQHI